MANSFRLLRVPLPHMLLRIALIVIIIIIVIWCSEECLVPYTTVVSNYSCLRFVLTPSTPLGITASAKGVSGEW